MDKAKRVEMIHEMQKMVFEESPYLVLAYTSDGQAYRSDRFACFVPQPKPDGVLVMQYGAANYTLMRPTEDAGDCDGVARAVGANSASSSACVVGRRRLERRADRWRRRAGPGRGGWWRRGPPSTGDRGRARVSRVVQA